jgi:uncharacterized LabA/DUF88 family protein
LSNWHISDFGGFLQRVIGYIDGFNLYFGLKARRWKRYYWLDPARLVENLCLPNQQLLRIHFFTARISDSRGNSADAKRQTTYLDALATIDKLEIQEGHYLEKTRECRQCGNRWPDYEEKMTDVNIATRMLIDAYEDCFDTAMLVSADSDLVTPVREIRRRFPEKRIVAAMPPRRHSHDLATAVHASFQIGEQKIRKSQLPEEVPTRTGFVLRRPTTWK